jgi:hypothetical protein
LPRQHPIRSSIHRRSAQSFGNRPQLQGRDKYSASTTRPSVSTGGSCLIRRHKVGGGGWA